MGIFGKLTKLDAPLKPGDRVEIYHSVIADPKTVPCRAAAWATRTMRTQKLACKGDRNKSVQLTLAVEWPGRIVEERGLQSIDRQEAARFGLLGLLTRSAD